MNFQKPNTHTYNGFFQQNSNLEATVILLYQKIVKYKNLEQTMKFKIKKMYKKIKKRKIDLTKIHPLLPNDA